MKNKVLLLIILLFLVLMTCGTVAAANNTTERISISTDGNQSNDQSSNPSISADGRYVTFTSYASNLVPGNTNGVSDVFVRDLVLNTTERVSISSTGEEGNSNSKDPAISADGRYVTFTSYASNLVPGDTNGASDIFVRDRLLGITKRISITNTGSESNSDSSDPAISADGRFIVFSSYATNLVPSDNNGKCDIFSYDNDSGQITRLTISNMGNEANGDSNNPTINGDGSLIAFISYANNLVENDTDSYSGLFIFNRNSNSLEKVDISDIGGYYYSFYHPSISADGSYLAFTMGGGSLFIYNIQSQTTEQVEISWNGELNSLTMEPSISADGRYVAVASANHVVSDSTDRWMDIYIYDQFSKTTKIITSSNGETSFYSSYQPSISADGHIVAFSSVSDELIPDDTNHYKDIFVYSEDYSLYASINPNLTKSGDIITVQVSSDPNIVSVSASILDQSYALIRGSNGIWSLDYIVPQLTDGFYPVDLTVTDSAGNQRNVSLGFTVDNTPPVISATATPDLVKSGYSVSIDAFTSSDTLSITALILGETFDLYNQDTMWNLSYLIPNVPDGIYPILLTATDKAGNQNTTTLYFTVDNTPPTLLGSVTPDTVQTYDNITITAISNSDAVSISALILDQTYDLVKQADDTWILKYYVPYALNDNYPILLTAIDEIGNEKTLSLSFNVFNPVDNQAPVVSGNITHADMMYGEFPSNPWIAFRAFSDPDTISVTALVLSKIYDLYLQEDGSWASSYSSWLEEGNYTAIFTAQDCSGNQGTQIVNFTVRNISPIITYTVTPNKLRSGNSLVLTVNLSLDPLKVWVLTPSEDLDLEKQANGSWAVNYTIPPLGDGYKNIYIYCLYEIGWFSPDNTTIYKVIKHTGFTVDNTPPTIFSVSATPNPIKSEDNLEISCTTESCFQPDDTVKVTATIFGSTFNLNQISTWSYWFNSNSGSNWSIQIIAPQVLDGSYSVLIIATDDAGNQNTKIINLTVDNTPPVMSATITPNKLKYIDFSRPTTVIIAQSSSDTKEIHAYLEYGSGYTLQYSNSNNNWILQLNFPYLIPLGSYIVNLKAFDYAGNEAESSVTYYVYQNLNVKNPLIKPTGPGSDSTNNNEKVGESSSAESSTGETSLGSSTAFSGGSACASADDPNAGTTNLKNLLQILLMIGDLCTIILAIGLSYILITSLLAVLAVCGVFIGIFLIFMIALIIAALILVLILIIYSYIGPRS